MIGPWEVSKWSMACCVRRIVRRGNDREKRGRERRVHMQVKIGKEDEGRGRRRKRKKRGD